ncbi:hypothetical protein BS78_02G130900 [Paspalum vaginatum]|nr:hypothetical protein BS78_02G130900 [Paspalum vaginatum]
MHDGGIIRTLGVGRFFRLPAWPATTYPSPDRRLHGVRAADLFFLSHLCGRDGRCSFNDLHSSCWVGGVMSLVALPMLGATSQCGRWISSESGGSRWWTRALVIVHALVGCMYLNVILFASRTLFAKIQGSVCNYSTVYPFNIIPFTKKYNWDGKNSIYEEQKFVHREQKSWTPNLCRPHVCGHRIQHTKTSMNLKQHMK